MKRCRAVTTVQTQGLLRKCVYAGCSCLLLWVAGLCSAEVFPVRGDGDPRVRSARYLPDEVYRVQGFVGYQIDFQFEPGESFVGLAAGDIEGLMFVAQDNHLFLKPRVAFVGTNLTILTTRRQYQFDYTASSRRPASTDPDLIYAIRFEYPSQKPSQNTAAPDAIDQRLAMAPSMRSRNTDYWFCGNSELKPVSAWDDGVHTHIRFDVTAEWPVIFVLGSDGAESLLNFNVEDGDVVVHRVARQFVLRRGALSACVVNKGFAESGRRLDSGTIAPDVERDAKGAVP